MYKHKIQLYPTSGRIITDEDNYDFITTKDIDLKTYSNGFVYVKFLKTLIPSDAVVEEAYLYLHIISIGGTTSEDYDIVVDVYAASEEIDSTKNMEDIRDLRGTYISGESFSSNSINDESIKIDITEFVQDYIYGASVDYGLIIEPKIKDLPAMSQFASVYDESNDRLFLIGGDVALTESIPDYNMDVYVYDPENNSLVRIESDNRPIGRISMYAAMYEDCIYIYGGEKYYLSGVFYQDLWKFDTKNKQWSEISVTNTGPGYLSEGKMVINQDGILYLIHGKNSSGIARAKIWSLNLEGELLSWQETTQTASDPSYIKAASRNFSIVRDERVGHEYEYYIIGGVLLGGSVSADIHKIKLQNNSPEWLNTKDLSATVVPSHLSSASIYNDYIYYFVGHSETPSDNVDNRNNILYRISISDFSAAELVFEGTKCDKRDHPSTFVYRSIFYVVNGYITEQGTERLSSNIWSTDLSVTSLRRWTQQYNQSQIYSENANTIKIAPIGSFYISERQSPFIDILYNFSTNYNVETEVISPVITRDSYISRSSPYINYGTANYVEVKKFNNESGVEQRGLFYINLTSIPDTSDILSAILYIPRSSNSEIGGLVYPPCLITEDWAESEVNWVDRKDGQPWETVGGRFDENYNSYNLIVGANMCKYDITRIVQQIKGSFGVHLVDYYGIAFYEQNVKFDSKQLNDNSFLMVKYIDSYSDKQIGEVTLVSPVAGTMTSETPVLKFKVPYNTYDHRLHFKIEVSTDIFFSDQNITTYSTEVSLDGWSWNSVGDDVTYEDFPENGIYGYTEDVSLVKFDTSGASVTLAENGWFWRVTPIV